MVKATAMMNKDQNSKLLGTPKGGFVQKKKNNKFKQTPTGKIALINGSKSLNNNNSNKQQFGKEKSASPQKFSAKNKGQKKENSPNTNKKNSKKSKANQSLSEEDINEGVVLKKQELMEESDDTESEEESDNDDGTQNVPNILGHSLADDTDDDDEEFEVENAKKVEVNKGVTMFKGVKSNKKANDSLKSSDRSSSALDTDEDEDDDDDDDDSEDIEDDDDEQESDEEEGSGNEADEFPLGIKALLGNSIAEDDDDDEDFVEPDGNEEDDDISDEDEEEEGDNSLLDNSQKSNTSKTDLDSSFEESANRTIFVGNLPTEVTEKDLQKLFKKFGEIETVRIRGVVPKSLDIPKRVAAITKNFHPKLKSIYAYVQFKSEESVKAALSLNGTMFKGNTIRVDTSVRTQKKYDAKKSVYLGNLPFKIDENSIRKHFEGCGEIESIRVVKDNRTGVGKGFGYVNFTTEDAVALAFELNGTTLLNRDIVVKSYVEQQDVKQKKRSHSAGSGGRNYAAKHFKDNAGKASPVRHKDNAKKGGNQQKFEKKQLSPQQTKTFQGQKADKNKKKGENKLDKKKKILAQKLTAKPKKPTN